MVAWERQSAWISSCSCAAVACAAEAVREIEDGATADDRELAERSLRCEVAAAVRLSEVTADSRIMVADAPVRPALSRC